MSQSLQEAIPKVLKTLWELEKELRSAARNSVVLRREDAQRHLSDARRHLDALLGLARGAKAEQGDDASRAFDASSTPPSVKH
jgi:hypothetical protein